MTAGLFGSGGSNSVLGINLLALLFELAQVAFFAFALRDFYRSLDFRIHRREASTIIFRFNFLLFLPQTVGTESGYKSRG
jgi:hypothetical protein